MSQVTAKEKRQWRKSALSAAVSDGEIAAKQLPGGFTEQGLNNSSLPNLVDSHDRAYEGRIASWAISFERLLLDPLGVQFFTAFLKKEFSEENILFYQACQDMQEIPGSCTVQLQAKARDIYSKFLSDSAATPVNVDSQAQISDACLQKVHPSMFSLQQQQIFNLMKFDSYTRFLKSEVYQDCLRAEVEGHSVPCGTLTHSSPVVCITSPERANIRKTMRKNKEGNEEEDGQSVLGNIMLWPQIWGSIGRTPKRTEDIVGQAVQTALLGNATIKQGGLVPTSTQSPSVTRASSTEKDLNNEQSGTGQFCRVQLPDSSSAVISVQAGLSVRDALSGLTEKRSLKLIALDVFLLKGMKALDLETDSEMLTNKEIRLEKRVLFRLDMNSMGKAVGVKAKQGKPIVQVLQSVLSKYGIQQDCDNFTAHLFGKQELLDMSGDVLSLDGLHVVMDVKNPGDQAGKVMAGKQKLRETHSIPGSRAVKEAESLYEDVRQSRKKKEGDEWLDLLSKAQRRRADDQRGLLRKEDLVLPDFLKMVSSGEESPASSDAEYTSSNSELHGSPLRNTPSASHSATSLDHNATVKLRSHAQPVGVALSSPDRARTSPAHRRSVSSSASLQTPTQNITSASSDEQIIEMPYAHNCAGWQSPEKRTS
uniref:regulator of G-protein signaling 12-like isoform X2 n=1 Tax=Myxine glutinosa TaxID=7769 RepID=UPI00358E993E